MRFGVNVKIPLMVTADYATIDPITGKLHILGVFRAIYTSTFPMPTQENVLGADN